MFKIIFLLSLMSCNSSNKNPGNNPDNSLQNKNLKKNIFKNDFDKADNAILNNNLEQLKEAIKDDDKILTLSYSESTFSGKTLLMQALDMQNENPAIDREDIIEVLFKGSDLSVIDKNGFSVLHYAIFNEKYVQMILENEHIDVNCVTKNMNETPLMLAVSEGHLGSARILLNNKNSNTFLINRDKENLLHRLATGIVYKNGKISVAFRDSDRKKKEEALKNYKNIFKLLANSGKFNMKEALNEKNIHGQTPLQLFENLIDSNIDEDRKVVETLNRFKEGSVQVYNREDEILYWKEIKSIFLPLFQQKL